MEHVTSCFSSGTVKEEPDDETLICEEKEEEKEEEKVEAASAPELKNPKEVGEVTVLLYYIFRE